MAKFIKSIFHTGERKTLRCDEEESPPLDGRRKLSISRSGRMKANKRRLSLSLDVYGQEQKDGESKICNKSKASEKDNKERQEITPEQEIDSAFEVIEKS